MTGKPGPILSVSDLKSLHGDQVVLQNISFQVGQGEILVVLGKSGCGKSTLLRHLIGLDAPAEGQIFIEGRNMTQATEAERLTLLQRIGVMYQGGALFGSMTLQENILLPVEELTHLPEEARQLLAWLKLTAVGLDKYAHHFPSEISGGMQKRAALARAMALDPVILFLDEPSAGLDPVTSAGLDELILRLNKSLGMTFIVVTHELPSVYAIADRVILLDPMEKTIIAEGMPTELRNSSDSRVRDFFMRNPTNRSRPS